MNETARIIEFSAMSESSPLRGEFVALRDDGCVRVHLLDGREWDCEWLNNGTTAAPALKPGDRLVVLPPAGREPAVVLGRIGRYHEPQPQAHVTIEAGETLTLKCGESSVNLRADGKLMVRGEDLLLRSKGTHRIKAGTVAIN